ncbi:dTDP-4-dehydrorhamnose reductase [Tenacibaculum sp. IB213877]|uniref:dTDP-4-dehydrorhamnose reductase n=1 Tax=Tenacibaculum sp. IB213877 TaxID=3097351 RepID=UPI002A5AE100|nr:dTDP-4-dehydrorhamnose reductase [Tenacibaculum sp. IB213877]MDY0781047.1 dTDP-4-dehydrorhamnose reductase [Tenacibaculum sp. IB213877]
MKKVLITGSNGLLGQSLLDLLLPEHEYQIFALSKGKNRYPTTKGYNYFSIDLTDKKSLDTLVKQIQPNFIINTAAMTNVDACEEFKEECDKINVELVQNLVDVSKKLDCHLIHISTDFIFDGNDGPYKENDKANPLSYYGVSKLKSEEIILNSGIDYTILRTILVYGKVHDMSRNNIVLWVKKSLEEGKELTIVEDQYRMPTYVVDLALACKKAMDAKVKGVFNVSSNTLLSIYEIAQQIAEVFELDTSLLKPISTQTLNQKAKRPAKTGFNLAKTEKELGLHFKSFREDLHRFKQKLN